MNIENKQIMLKNIGGRTVGYIDLDKIAYPDTVKVFLQGFEIFPYSYNYLGHPIFTEEQAKIAFFKQNKLCREKNDANFVLKAKVYYSEKPFDIDRATFDSIDGIRNSFQSLSSLNEMLNNRKRYLFTHPGEKLNKFVLFERYILDEMGNVFSIYPKNRNIVIFSKTIEPFSDFLKRNNQIVYSFKGYAIPKDSSICSCCGKPLSIEDIIFYPCFYSDGKYYHESCWIEYTKYKEIDDFTQLLMNYVYKKCDYTFQLLPNRYWGGIYHIPWFLFRTIDGDIVMGRRKKVISIEWQSNYKSFDFNKLFLSENVTKWIDNKTRGIHAWSKEDAIRYLRLVVKSLHPNYSSF